MCLPLIAEPVLKTLKFDPGNLTRPQTPNGDFGLYPAWAKGNNGVVPFTKLGRIQGSSERVAC